MPKAKPSMYLDFLNRKKSEIDYINGAVVTLSKKKGLSAPYNETLTEIIKTKEKEFVLRFVDPNLIKLICNT